MFDIEVLKEMKLPDLQEIAKAAQVKKYRTLKKDELIYQILDMQAANPDKVKSEEETSTDELNQDSKPKRTRIKVEKESSAKPIKKDVPKKNPVKETPEPQEI